MRQNICVLVMALTIVSACNSRPEAVTSNSLPEERASSSPEQNQASSAASSPTTGSTYAGDSLQHLALSSFELVSYRQTNDTLQLVSTSDFLYYPFGNSSTIQAFRQKHPTWTFAKETDRTDPTAILYRGTTRNGFIKLFADSEKKSLEIVAGDLSGPGIKLANGLAVGATRTAFFMPFFNQPATLPHSRVVALISGLDGIRHYYTFRADTLARIVFETDYQFDKK